MKIAIIGMCGHFNYILPSVVRNGYELVGLSPGPGEDAGSMRIRRDGYAKRGFVFPFFEDWKDMLNKTKPDIAVVNPVFAYAAEVSIYALGLGIHVFSEKPAATDLEKLRALENAYCAANEKKRVCYAGMFGIWYESPMQTVRKAVLDGSVGKICMINAQKSYKLGKRDAFYAKRETYGGTIPWVSIHAIDWIYMLAKSDFSSVFSLTTTSCNGGNGEMESACLSLFKLENGVIAEVNTDMLRPSGANTHGDDRVRVVGDKGVLEARGGEVFLIDASGERKLELLPESDIFDNFVSNIKSGHDGDLSAKRSFHVTKAALAARQSADTGHVVKI